MPPTPKMLELDGRTQTIAEWAKELGISEHTIYWRLRNGKSIAGALAPKSEPAKTTPKAPRSKPAPTKSEPSPIAPSAPVPASKAPTTSALAPLDLLRACGWDAQQVGTVPGGDLLLVRSAG